MTSILDIYDSLPDDEKRIINKDILHRIKEGKKAEYALTALLPAKIRKYYVPHFAEASNFVGLVCRSCNHWIEYGHKDTCPMPELMGDFDYKAAGQAIKEIKAMDRPPT